MIRDRVNFARLAAACAAVSVTCAADEPPQTAPTPDKPASVFDRETPLPKQVQNLEIDEKVGSQLPLDAEFTNSAGRRVKVGDYFKHGKPAIVAMVYYKCPVVCSVVMEKMNECFDKLDYTVGHDFNALLFSIDPTETPEEAAQVKRGTLAGYAKPVTPEVEAGWEFHTGSIEQNARLADAFGFKYRALADGQFGHPAAIYVVTPEGKVSRYFYGFAYPPRDVKLSLIDASQGKLVKSMGDRFMAYCFQYDASTGRYTLAAIRVMQVGGVLSAILVGGLVGTLFVGDRIRRRTREAAARSAPEQAGATP
ncbi:MAG: SCO family protein [Phycisphaerae bacterium]|nr:SCO family protein [Phycisphaerae bacterium]